MNYCVVSRQIVGDIDSELNKEMSCCNHEFEYEYTIDEVHPGDIVSTAVFKCIKCGKEFLDWEIDNEG